MNPLKTGSSSVRFDMGLEKSVRVRFGSTQIPKSRFEIGLVRLKPNRTVQVRFDLKKTLEKKFYS